MTLKFECLDAGGLLIADQSFFSNPHQDDEVEYVFSIALDLEGNTNIICDFEEDEDWDNIWHRETLFLVDKINNHEFSFVTLPVGDFNLTLSDILLEHDENVFYSDSLIQVLSEKVLIFEASHWAECTGTRKLQSLHDMSLENGCYRVQIQIDDNIKCQAHDNSEDTDLVGNILISITKAETINLTPLLEIPCYQRWHSMSL